MSNIITVYEGRIKKDVEGSVYLAPHKYLLGGTGENNETAQ
jgi:hypothetical protein